MARCVENRGGVAVRFLLLWFGSYLHRKREGLRHFAFLPFCIPLERLHCACLVKMEDRIKLIGQTWPAVVADTLRIGTRDDPDRPLENGLPQSLRSCLAVTPHEHNT